MMTKIKLAENTVKIQPEKKYRGNGIPFKKGQSGNPAGKPKGSVNEVTKFKQAIEAFEKEQNKDIYKFILEKASRYPQVLIAIFKALVPQQTESNIKVEHVNPYTDLTDDELTTKAYEIFNRPGTAGIRRDIN